MTIALTDQSDGPRAAGGGLVVAVQRATYVPAAGFERTYAAHYRDVPTLDDVRSIAMALPEVEEIVTWGVDIGLMRDAWRATAPQKLRGLLPA